MVRSQRSISPMPPSLPPFSLLPPCPSNIASLCLRHGNAKEEKKGMELGVDGGGGRLVMREEGVNGGGEEGGRKVKIHFETHFQLGVHKLLSQVSQNGGP